MDLNDLNVLKPTEFRGAQQASNLQPSSLQPTPPPVPLRPNARPMGYDTFANPLMTNAFNNPLFSSYGTNGYFNNYNSYSAYNNPYMASSYGNVAGSSNSFLRVAEDNSRYAFQSIQSVVQAFSAVSAMFESTFHAVYNSFRAVVGVADQFYRLKMHLSNIFSAFALFKALKHIARKLLRILRRQTSADNDEDLWSKLRAGGDAETLVKNNSKRQTNWPLVLFFAVVVGGPWLIWRILSSIEGIHKDDSSWMSGKIDHFIAVSEYDYDAENADELSFKRGQKIIIAPKEYQPKMRGWLLGTVNGTTSGIVPANYLKILGKKVVTTTSAQQQPTKTPTNNPDLSSTYSMEQIFGQSSTNNI